MDKKVGQIYSVVNVIAGLFIYILLSAIFGLVKMDKTTNEYLYIAFSLPQIGYILVYLILGYLFFKLKPKEFLLKENVKVNEYMLAIVIAASLFFFAILPNNFITSLIHKSGSTASVTIPKMDSAGSIILSNLIICVLPAIGEELIYRKALCDGLKPIGDVKVIIISGLIFALQHFNLAQFVHQFIVGLILAFIYVKSRNITLTMLMHFINNLLALNLTSFTDNSLWDGYTTATISACVCGGIVLILSLILAYFYYKNRSFMFSKKASRIETNNIESEEENNLNSDALSNENIDTKEDTKINKKEKINPLVHVLIILCFIGWIVSLLSTYNLFGGNN